MFAVRIASFECDICAKLFIKKERLSKHQSVHFIDRNFICVICSANFKTKYQLNRHLQYNRQNADYICDQCGKRFKTSAEIERHQVVHAIDRKYRCELCNSTFKSEVHLKKHKRSVHETNGNVGYICDKCNRSYRDKSTFITHFHEKHTNLFSISNHICTICASIYATQVHLSRHMRVVHRKGAMIICDICDKSYPQREYSKHFESVHRITNIKCELCNKMFKNNVQFKCHRRRTHNDERKCDRCEQLFKSSNGLLYHIIRAR
jgi:KRAB domain-containing zinc finger protein